MNGGVHWWNHHKVLERDLIIHVPPSAPCHIKPNNAHCTSCQKYKCQSFSILLFCYCIVEIWICSPIFFALSFLTSCFFAPLIHLCKGGFPTLWVKIGLSFVILAFCFSGFKNEILSVWLYQHFWKWAS